MTCVQTSATQQHSNPITCWSLDEPPRPHESQFRCELRELTVALVDNNVSTAAPCPPRTDLHFELFLRALYVEIKCLRTSPRSRAGAAPPRLHRAERQDRRWTAIWFTTNAGASSQSRNLASWSCELPRRRMRPIVFVAFELSENVALSLRN